MAHQRGKQWEDKVKNDLLKLPNIALERVPDQMTGFKNTSQNPCDFFVYLYPNFYYIECKSVNGNTLTVDIAQYDRLIKRLGPKGIRAGVILWWIPHQKVAYVPIKTFEKIKNDGKRSINIKMLNDNEYRIIEIPSVTKRVFPDCDYSILNTLQDGD